MPRLLFLLACEKSIIEQHTQQVSIIGLIDSFTIAVPEPPPQNAVIPRDWSIVSGWEPIGEDAQKEFVQCLSITLPNGKPFIKDNRAALRFQNGMKHHIATRIQGLPVGVPGKFRVEVCAELAGKPATEKSQIFLEIIHQPRLPSPSPADE